MIDHIKNNSHQSKNSGRISPLYFERNYDSKRYMRTDDIEVRRSTSKPIIQQKNPEGFHEKTNMIEYKQIPKQVKLTVQQGRLPFTRRYGREKYGDEDNSYSEHSLLYHVNQTEKDHDHDMKTRRFKADVRRSEPGAYSTKSSSIRSMLDINSASLINPKSMNSQIEHMSQKQIIEDITKPKIVETASQVPNSRFANRSNRSASGNLEMLNSSHKASQRLTKKSSKKSRHYVIGKIDPSLPYKLGPEEYLEEVTDEEEESELEENNRRKNSMPN